MALTDNNQNGFYMPVAPAYGGGYGNGSGFFGGDWAWIILLLLIGGGGWGYYTGAVDDLFVFDRALSSEEVACLSAQ